jgi:predicted acyltransferase
MGLPDKADARSKPSTPALPQRVVAIDAFRGFVMLLMMAEVLNLPALAGHFKDNVIWRGLAFHSEHVEWEGCSLHDLIQPGFSFLVGVALPFSLASRLARGQKFGRMFGHAVWRSLLLILLGIFLRSTHSSRTNFTFEDTLTQIGLGYTFLFLLGFRGRWFQASACALILVGYWAAFALYAPGPDFRYAAVGVPATWSHHYTGLAAHWNKNSNLGWAFDTWFLNLFPREHCQAFRFNRCGSATLSFIPTQATIILGLNDGGWIKEQAPSTRKMARLVVSGVALLALGGLLDWSWIFTSVKGIWTAAWSLT